MAKNGASNGDVIQAAGGIVVRDSPRGPEFAVIHRPRHQDWTLPKGKLDPRERWQDAALREVEEETGLDVALGEFAGSCSYMTRNAPKVVLYWHMQLVGPAHFVPEDPGEVDQLMWLTRDEVLQQLTHVREKRVFNFAVPDPSATVDVEHVIHRRVATVRTSTLPPAQGSKLLRWLLRNVSRNS